MIFPRLLRKFVLRSVNKLEVIPALREERERVLSNFGNLFQDLEV